MRVIDNFHTKDELLHSERVKFLTAADKAYKIIFDKIMSGEYKPGTKLSRRNMAQVTGVSVIPVIEALKQLEEDGLVESKVKWGSFVTIITSDKIKDMYVLREAVECQVARILAKEITADQEEELRILANKLDTTKYTNETTEYINRIHYTFHSKLAEFTGYKSLINTLRKINLFFLLCKGVSARRKSECVTGWHTQLVNGITSGDPDEAQKIMSLHVLDSVKAIFNDLP